MGDRRRDAEGPGTGRSIRRDRRALSAGRRQDHHDGFGAQNRQAAVVERRSAQRWRRTLCQPRLARGRTHSCASLQPELSEGSLTATEIWSPITSYYDNLAAPNSGLMYANTPWSGHYDVQGTIWATAHTTQFAQPGWQYLDSASGYLPEKGSYVSLRSPDKKNWSVILETIDAKHPQTVSFRWPADWLRREVHIWETNNSRIFEQVADVKPVDGAFNYNFDPDSLYSLTTTTGQGKGTAQPPPAASFPFPYADDFEKTPLRARPKYLSDQDGAFEVRPCDRTAGSAWNK